MVRHEAAEALGGIPSPGVDGDGADEEGQGNAVLELLREWAGKNDAPQVVRDSCVVAVDMWEVSCFICVCVCGLRYELTVTGMRYRVSLFPS